MTDLMPYMQVNQDGQIQVTYNDKKWIIKSMEDVTSMLIETGHSSFMCSSSMDLPEDYTKDKKVIDLCDEIRNGDER